MKYEITVSFIIEANNDQDAIEIVREALDHQPLDWRMDSAEEIE